MNPSPGAGGVHGGIPDPPVRPPTHQRRKTSQPRRLPSRISLRFPDRRSANHPRLSPSRSPRRTISGSTFSHLRSCRRRRSSSRSSSRRRLRASSLRPHQPRPSSRHRAAVTLIGAAVRVAGDVPGNPRTGPRSSSRRKPPLRRPLPLRPPPPASRKPLPARRPARRVHLTAAVDGGTGDPPRPAPPAGPAARRRRPHRRARRLRRRHPS